MKKYVYTAFVNTARSHSVRIIICYYSSTRQNFPPNFLTKSLSKGKNNKMDFLKSINVQSVCFRCGNMALLLRAKQTVRLTDMLAITSQALHCFRLCLLRFSSQKPCTLSGLARLSSKTLWRRLFNKKNGLNLTMFSTQIHQDLLYLLPFQGHISIDFSPRLETLVFLLLIAHDKYMSAALQNFGLNSEKLLNYLDIK